MSSAPGSITQEIADALAVVLDTVDDVRAYAWDPAGAGFTSPCVVISLPRIRRRDADSAESELLAEDLFYTFPVSLYVKASNPVASQARMAQLIDSLIAAVDANPTLGITATTFRVEDAVLSELTPQLLAKENGDAVAWEYEGVAEIRAFKI